jgi:hypothetical protein
LILICKVYKESAEWYLSRALTPFASFQHFVRVGNHPQIAIHTLKEKIRKDALSIKRTVPTDKDGVPITRRRKESVGADGVPHPKPTESLSNSPLSLNLEAIFTDAIPHRIIIPPPLIALKRSLDSPGPFSSSLEDLTGDVEGDDFLVAPADSEILLSRLNNIASSISIPDAIEHSAKMHCLVELLVACEKINEKVLVFSRSLPTLDYLEKEIKSRLKYYTVFRLCGGVKQTSRPKMISDFHSSTGGTVFITHLTSRSFSFPSLLEELGSIFLVHLVWLSLISDGTHKKQNKASAAPSDMARLNLCLSIAFLYPTRLSIVR